MDQHLTLRVCILNRELARCILKNPLVRLHSKALRLLVIALLRLDNIALGTLLGALISIDANRALVALTLRLLMLGVVLWLALIEYHGLLVFLCSHIRRCLHYLVAIRQK